VQRLLYQIVVFILLTTAGILICRQLLKIPNASMKKNIKNLQAKKEKPGRRILNRFIMPLVKPVSRLIRIDPVKEARMVSMLRRGGLELTPKEYYARAILCGSVTLLLIPLLTVIGAGNLAPIALIFAVVLYFHFMTDLKDSLKEKKRQIEIELPSFVRSILYKLDDIRGDRQTVVQVDLIQIFEDYLKIASDVFSYDVSVLVLEMKAKDIETALRNFNERIGLTDVTFLVNALIGLHRGEHQGEALAYISRDMDVKAKEALKKKLNKLPGTVKRASIPLVVVTLTCLLYVIGSHMVKSMGGLF
jgi:flagellar protein FlaJ